MKRIILTIGALLIGLAMRAQSVTYTCRYWFDQNFAQATTTTFSESTWQAELDVGSLTEGLHALYLHVMDTSMNWSAPQSYLFLKINESTDFTYRYWFDQDHAAMQSGALGNGQLLLDVANLDEGLHALHVMLIGSECSTSQTYLFLKTDTWENGTPNYIYHCWFDEDFANQQSDTLGTGHFLLDVTDLEEGMHTVNVLLEGSRLTASQSYMFVKVSSFTADSVDMSHLVYHCWFDQDLEHQQTDSLGDGHILLDVDGLANGLHTVNVMLEGSAMNAPTSYMFMKVAAQDPSAELQYHCWFDQDYSTVQTGLVGSGIFELEVSDLPNGIHTVNVQLDNETCTAPQRYLFYKQPLGGYGIARWEYWLNDDFDERNIITISPSLDTLDIISLLSVGHPALRSSCFHFHPNGDVPYINAKNKITFRFCDNEMHIIDKSAFYVDEQIQQDIVATVFERNTTETFAAPRNNQITWYKLDAVVGDSLAFKANKACTIQLFAPSGEEVFNVSGPESVTLGGFHTWEDGTYYLAVHDVIGSGETVSVTYQYLHKYAVLAYDVHLVGNGGCSTITFQGNGFNSLLDAYLVNYQNDTIHRLDIGHESNITTTVTFDFYQVNMGVYDAVFQFYGETIRINGALEVQEPVDIILTSTVSYPSQFLRNTPCTYTYTITNNGNMSAYGVPLFVYISSATFEGISHIEFDGLMLPSFSDVLDLDSLSIEQVEKVKIWANEMGHDYYFQSFSTFDENIGDTIVARSNFFFINLAPFETKTLSLKITADETLNVWMTVPNEIVQPVIFELNRGFREQYCCVHEKIECALSALAAVINIAALVSDAIALASLASANPAVIACLASVAALENLSSCVASSLSASASIIGGIVCADDYDGFWSTIGRSFKQSGWSIAGAIFSCIKLPNIDASVLKEAKDYLLQAIRGLGNILKDEWSIGTIQEEDLACVSTLFEPKPNCPRGDHDGGPSDPVNSLDPNDIYGYLSESGSHYMRQNIQTVQYEIEFENDTTLATAAAHTIIVRNKLDASKFDLNSLAARSVTIGDKRLDLNGEQTFARTLDLRPELNVIAQIEQDYNPTTGVIQWTIQSLDPMTMEPTDDPNQGVLPVNYYGNGVGFIDYSINLKHAFPDGTQIKNRAGIIFDQNEVITTPIWTNIIDAVEPTSYIENVTFEDDTLNFSFVSSDNRSGVWYHTLYYRNDSTEMEWQVKKPRIFGNSYTLHFDEGQTTEYLVMAVDSAGNHEEKGMVAEYVHYYGGPEPVCQTITLSPGWNWCSFNVDITLDDLKAALVAALPGTQIAIKSKGNGNLAYNGRRWKGQLSSLDVSQMYMIGVSTSCEITLEGEPINPTEHPAIIRYGANWIGFPLDETMTVRRAFARFPVAGDVVKSKDNGSAKFNGTKWVGTLKTLEPGQGYIYMSKVQGNRILTFPVNAR